ncbi:MAG: TIGR00725 family protein [Verrucomicrobiota bacterium]
MHSKIVSVVGPGQCDPKTASQAEMVGRLLATNGITVVCGGLGGVMEALCRGAKMMGGTTIGILPGTDASAANAYVDIPIPTGMGEGRNILVVRAGKTLIAVAGEYGTLSEIGFALKLGLPVIGLGTWQLLRGGTIDRGIRTAKSPSEAVQFCLEILNETR